MLEAVQDGRALKYASATLKDDREIVLEAVKQNGHALEYARLRCRTTARSCCRPSSVMRFLRCHTPRSG